ncbi:SpoIIIAH-like family protein [Desulfallas sp. Bu1-1]|uniref:SpoIIIAH-like family protein n=1 Tax=Desulfallas sp. Bu1-1 TaxID=2787620 RepID=UPI00189F7E8D|nr:SpoIIIAH-like family protein [Desulfallas sp. Bu1-1]MBF7082100.1 SpoIIIAH-like family protein [Desulfallas sp. Bu1-1]
MIKVIKLNRKGIMLILLVVLGLGCCVVGFGGLTERLLGREQKQVAPASVTVSEPDQESGKSIGGGVPVEQRPAGDAPELTDGARETGSGEAAYFEEYRMDRERARGMQVELLREVMASSSTDEDTRKMAHEQFLRISNNISKEMELENLIRARGFQDAAVFLDNESVTVVVQPGEKMTADAENDAIAELVSKSTGVAENNVIIITKDF